MPPLCSATLLCVCVCVYSCYIAERTKRMAQIWKQVFSDDPSRVVVVIAGQASWPVASEKVFTCRCDCRVVVK